MRLVLRSSEQVGKLGDVDRDPAGFVTGDV